MSNGVVSTGDGLATGGLEVLMFSAGATLAAVAEPSGAAPAVMGATVLAMANIRSPGPFYEADGAWTSLAGSFADLAGEFERLRGEIASHWEGAGLVAFDEFVRTKVVPPLESLSEAALGAATGCNSIGGALWTHIIAWLGGTGVAVAGCISANAAGPASPGIKWTIIGGWLAFCVGIITAIVTLMTQASAANGAVSGGMVQMRDGFQLEEGRISSEALAMDDGLRDLVADPESWTRPQVLPGE